MGYKSWNDFGDAMSRIALNWGQGYMDKIKFGK